MNVWGANFTELYQRHLCRHSQLGINVIHFGALIGTYLAVYDLIFGLVQAAGHLLPATGVISDGWESKWVLLAVAVPYLVILAANLPTRVLAVTLLCVALFLGAFVVLPPVPLWALWTYPVAIWLCYKIQNWSHKIYPRETDMTEFNKKYHKGFNLFVLLTVYELPILLNYLCFGQKDWCA